MTAEQNLRICRARECAAQFFTFPNGGNYRRISPVIAGERPDWVIKAVENAVSAEVTPPEAAVAVLKGVVVHQGGIITTSDARVVFESLINTHHEKAFYDFARAEDGEHLLLRDQIAPAPLPPGEIYVHVKQSWDSNYGHWLIESLPRIALVNHLVRPQICKFIVSLVSPQMATVYRQTMAAMGVGEDQLIFSDVTPMFCDLLVYPLPLTEQPWVKAPIVLPILRQMAERLRELHAETTAPRPEKLFVVRPPGMRRQLLNQPDICARLEACGYTTVLPAALSCAEQAVIFSRATHIVGTIGAELANIVFAQDGVRLFTLAPSEMLDDFYLDLVSHMHGHYYSLHGPAAEPEKRWTSDFRIDVEAFDRMLSQFEKL